MAGEEHHRQAGWIAATSRATSSPLMPGMM
jgi:hypothetical protein